MNAIRTLVSSLFCLIAISSITGCNFRFGNHVSEAPNPDNVTGYYESAPQALEFCASMPPLPQKCAERPANQIPREVSQVITNPLILALYDPASAANTIRTAYFIGLTTDNPSLPIDVNPDNTLTFLGSTSAETLWLDPSCTTKLWVEENGKFTTSGPFTTGFSKKLSGRVELQVDMIRSFDGVDGACAESLKAMHDCYLDSKQCGGATDNENLDRQFIAQDTFDAWIQAGVMTAGDILSVTKIAYKVSYQ